MTCMPAPPGQPIRRPLQRPPTQIQQAAARLETADHGRRAGAQRCGVGLGQADRGAWQLDAGRTASAHGRDAIHRLGLRQLCGQSFGASAQLGHVGIERQGHRRRRPDEGGLQRREGEFVDAQRSGRRMPSQLLDQLGRAEQQTRLWPAEELVTAGGDKIGAVTQDGRGVGFVGQQRMRRQQAGADVDHERRGQLGQLADADGRGESADVIVRRVDLEQEAGRGPDGLGIVAQMRAVRRADLPDPGARRGHQFGQPEAVADLDQLATADHDLLAGGQRHRGQQQGSGVVVDDVHGARGRHRAGQCAQCTAAAAGATTRFQVELDIGSPAGGHHRVDGGL